MLRGTLSRMVFEYLLKEDGLGGLTATCSSTFVLIFPCFGIVWMDIRLAGCFYGNDFELFEPLG